MLEGLVGQLVSFLVDLLFLPLAWRRGHAGLYLVHFDYNLALRCRLRLDH